MTSAPASGFAILVVAYGLSQFYRAFLAIVSGDLSRDLGLGPAGLGTLSAVWLTSFAVAQLPVGIALDRFGPRRCIGLTLIAAVAGALLFAGSTGPLSAGLAMALLGAGCSAVLMGGFFFIGRSYPAERFAFRTSLLVGLGTLGDPLSAAPLALLVHAIGWRASMVVMAGLTAAVALLAGLVLRDPEPLPQLRRGRLLRGLADIVSIRALWPLMPLAFVGYGVLICIRSLWIAPFLRDLHGFGTVELGYAALAMGLAISFGSIGFAILDRFAQRTKLVIALAIGAEAAGCLALAAFGQTSAALAVALLTAIGLAGSSYSLIMAHARAFFPSGSLGQGVTFVNLLLMGGAGTVQWLSGTATQAAASSGIAPAQALPTLFAAFGAVLAGAVLVYLLTPPIPRTETPP